MYSDTLYSNFCTKPLIFPILKAMIDRPLSFAETDAMYAHPQQSAGHDVQKLRKDAGKWLKDLREKAGLTQRQLAERVGVEYYTFISQLEVGRGRIPPDRYERWAAALHLRPSDFVKQLMRFYDPETYRLLFGDTTEQESACKMNE